MTVATTRPETILGDVAVAIHPDDPRAAELVGKRAAPAGPGARDPDSSPTRTSIRSSAPAWSKITPAHDPNDFQVGKRHQLEAPIVIEPDGKMNDLAGPFAGLDRFEARKRVGGAIAKPRTICSRGGAARRSPSAVTTAARRSSSRTCRSSGSCGWRRSRSRRFAPSRTAASRSIRNAGATSTCTGCATSRTGASRGSCGGGIAFRSTNATVAATWWRRMRAGGVRTLRRRANSRQDESVLDTWFSSWLCPVVAARLARTNRRSAALSPDDAAGDRLRDHLLLGGAHDHGEPGVHRRGAVLARCC